MNLRRFSEMRWPLIDQAMVSAANFLVGVALVRVFGIKEYGVYVLLWAVVQFSQSFQNALLIAPMQTVSQSMDKGTQDSYFNAIARWFVLFGLFCGAVVYIFSKAVEQWLPPFWNGDYALSVAIWLVTMQLQDGMRRWQMARGFDRKAFFSDVLAYPGQIMAVLLAGHFDLKLSQAIGCFGGVMAVAAVAAGLYPAIRAKGAQMSLVDAWRRSWPSSRWLAATALLQWTSANYILMTAAVVIGPAMTGAIRASQNLLAVAHVIFQAMENIVPVRAARKYSVDGFDALKSYLRKVGLVLLIFTSVVALFALIFSNEILKLVYGDATSEGVVAAAWYVPVYLAIAAALPIRTLLRVVGKTRPIFIAYVGSSVFAISSANFFASSYGVHGVMFGILACYSLILASLIFSASNVFSGVKG